MFSLLGVFAVDVCNCCGPVCHEAKGHPCAVMSLGTEPCHFTTAVKGELLVNPLLSTIRSCTLPGAVSKAEQDENRFPGTNHVKNFKPGCQEGDE